MKNYAGKITNKGAQEVKAADEAEGKKPKVVTGGDLRVGKKSK